MSNNRPKVLFIVCRIDHQASHRSQYYVRFLQFYLHLCKSIIIFICTHNTNKHPARGGENSKLCTETISNLNTHLFENKRNVNSIMKIICSSRAAFSTVPEDLLGTTATVTHTVSLHETIYKILYTCRVANTCTVIMQ